MSDINSVVVVGRLVEKPIIKYGASGIAVSNLRLANNVFVGTGKEEKVNWFTVVVFGKTAENCEKYLDKGRQIVVNGRLDWNSWETKDGQKRSKVQIVASRVQFIGGKPNTSGNAEEPGERSRSTFQPESSEEMPSDGPQENNQASEKGSNDFNNSTFESPIDDTDDIPF